MADESKRAWPSPESYERLRAEFGEVITARHAETVCKIKTVRNEGDLRESGSYQTAREEQLKLGGRTAELMHLLEGTTASEPLVVTKVQAGVIVTAKIAGEEEYLPIGSRKVFDHLDTEIYPKPAPLGETIFGLKEGKSTEFVTPAGRKVLVEIVKIGLFEG